MSEFLKKEGYKKGKTVSVHAMKVYEGRRGTAPRIVNLGTKWEVSRQDSFTPKISTLDGH
jgi:hypothetical protein